MINILTSEKMFKLLLVLLVYVISSPTMAINLEEELKKTKYVKPKLTKLHKAVFYGKNDVVKFYAQNGTDLNSLAGNDNTPLHMAANRGQLESTKILIQYGADKTIRNTQGETALDIAKKKGFKDIVKFLESN